MRQTPPGDDDQGLGQRLPFAKRGWYRRTGTGALGGATFLSNGQVTFSPCCLEAQGQLQNAEGRFAGVSPEPPPVGQHRLARNSPEVSRRLTTGPADGRRCCQEGGESVWGCHVRARTPCVCVFITTPNAKEGAEGPGQEAGHPTCPAAPHSRPQHGGPSSISGGLQGPLVWHPHPACPQPPGNTPPAELEEGGKKTAGRVGRAPQRRGDPGSGFRLKGDSLGTWLDP